MLHPDRLRDTVGRIEFVAKYGGYISILEDGVERWSTGNITAGPTTGWPYSQASDCSSATAKGLFCATIPTSPTPAVQGAMNSRIFQAAFAADRMRGTPNFAANYPLTPSPAMTNAEADTACAQPTHVKTTIYQGTNPIRVCTKESTSEVAGGRVSFLSSVYRYTTGASTAWIDPDGTLLAAPLAFYRVGDFLDKEGGLVWKATTSHAITSDNAIFKELSMWSGPSALADRANAAAVAVQVWSMKQALLQGSEECAPDSALCGSTPNAYEFSDGFTETIGRFVKGGKIGSRALVDGLEMLCELSNSHDVAVSQAPQSLTTLSDVDRAGAYLKAVGEALTRRASMMVFAKVPRFASEALGDASPTGAFPALSGQMGVQVSNLREALVAARTALPVISGSIEQVGAEMQSLRAQLDQQAVEEKVIDYKTLSTTLDRINSCAQSALSPASWVSFGTSTLVECANSAAQVAIGAKLSVLQKQTANDTAQVARSSFAERMSQIAQSIQTAGLALQESAERINAALSAIDGLRQEARLNVAKAVHMASFQARAQVAYDTAVGSLDALAQVRYERALKNAKLMTFFAKRAIEQRLGVRLSEMREALPLVQAPALWEGRLCTMGGTNDLASWRPTPSLTGASAPTTTGAADLAKFGDGFVGDYVTDLENFVESYRLAHNFHEGQDVAIISLRDDVMNVRKPCTIPGRNLLRSSALLDTNPDWSARTCNSVTLNSVAQPNMNCIAAMPILDPITKKVEAANSGLASSVNGASGYQLQFGDGSAGSACPIASCGWKAGSALGQLVTLNPGRYRFSWYTKDTASATTGAARASIVKLRPTGSLPAPVLAPAASCTPATATAGCFVFPQVGSGATWKRASLEFMITSAGSYEVGFGVDDATRPTYAVTLAAPMLERVLQRDMATPPGGATEVADFQATDAVGKVTYDSCEDTSGNLFRLNHWRRDCVHLCDTGFSSNCTTGPEYCYRELSFGVSQPWIQNGKLFNFSGFARGNFNYRIDSVALNFVGSGVRDCTNSATPSTCFNAGFVPYSIEHNGPFYVRNHMGNDFRAYLFDGRIEHARGLALERYLTNPLSSTDRELLSDYMRTELRGRPLDGSFVVRVWEEPGVQFEAIEDVQLALNYRYWTRFD